MAGSQGSTRPGAPTTGDLIVRNLVGGFEVIDVDGKRIVGPVDTFAAAYHHAKVEATGEVWQQWISPRGRPFGARRVTPAD